MKNVFAAVLTMICFSSAFSKECAGTDKIDQMLPMKTTMTFSEQFVIDVNEEQLYFQSGRALQDKPSWGRSISVSIKDAIYPNKTYVLTDIVRTYNDAEKKTDEVAGLGLFVFREEKAVLNAEVGFLGPQPVVIAYFLSQIRAAFDPHSSDYIDINSLKYNLGPHVALHAECKD